MIWLALLAFGCALGPAWLFARNLTLLHPPPASGNLPAAVLIPARDEALNITEAIMAALASGAAEVLVLDDGSTDRTAELVRAIAARDLRVRLLAGAPLPKGWLGKNFACAQLAAATEQPVLIFADADVRLTNAVAPRLGAFLEESGAQLASGVPRQITRTFSEQLLVPLIHFVLLGFLPLARMRASRHPAYATGCGQLIVVNAEAYRASGGHSAMRGRIHDGLALPKIFRAAGYRTDLFDATEVATCRMYRSNRAVWRGLAKNVHEGLGSPGLIGPATLVLGLGQIAPFLLLGAQARVVFLLALAASFSALAVRVIAARRFQQPFAAIVLHPFAIAALLGIQWWGLARYLLGRPPEWKGRAAFSAR